MSEKNLLDQEIQRRQAQAEAKKRAGRQYENEKALVAYRAEKRRAEEMLLMAPLSQN